jgi:hypothetical protein
LPISNGPLTVGIDEGYVRAQHKAGWFKVIVGKSLLAFTRGEESQKPVSSKCFAFVQPYDQKSKRRLLEGSKSQGHQLNQQITFLSNGGDTVRDLQLYLNPHAEHLLGWFHVSMRLTVLRQTAKGLPEKTCFVESTMNQVISKRFCKKQQRQWTQRGAHLLLQIRTRVLKGTGRLRFGNGTPDSARLSSVQQHAPRESPTLPLRPGRLIRPPTGSPTSPPNIGDRSPRPLGRGEGKGEREGGTALTRQRESPV